MFLYGYLYSFKVMNSLFSMPFKLNKLPCFLSLFAFIDRPVCYALFCWLSTQFSFQRIIKVVWNMWTARERHLGIVWESQVTFRKVNKNINSLVAVIL